MIYIYKDGKRVKLGNLPAYIYIDNSRNVVAKSFDKIDGYDNFVEANGDIFGQIVPKVDGREFYHQLKNGTSGKKIGDYKKIYNLPLIKALKCETIDVRTDELIANGIPYDNNLFSTSPEAQRNWIAMYMAKDVLSYPFSVTTLDEKEYSFTDSRFVQLFYLTGVSTINYHIASGRAIKLKVMACKTKAEVDAIVDPR